MCAISLEIHLICTRCDGASYPDAEDDRGQILQGGFEPMVQAFHLLIDVGEEPDHVPDLVREILVPLLEVKDHPAHPVRRDGHECLEDLDVLEVFLVHFLAAVQFRPPIVLGDFVQQVLDAQILGILVLFAQSLGVRDRDLLDMMDVTVETVRPLPVPRREELELVDRRETAARDVHQFPGRRSLILPARVLLHPFVIMRIVDRLVDFFAGPPREGRPALGAPHLIAARDLVDAHGTAGTGSCVLAQEVGRLDILLGAFVLVVAHRLQAPRAHFRPADGAPRLFSPQESAALLVRAGVDERGGDCGVLAGDDGRVLAVAEAHNLPAVVQHGRVVLVEEQEERMVRGDLRDAPAFHVQQFVHARVPFEEAHVEGSHLVQPSPVRLDVFPQLFFPIDAGDACLRVREEGFLPREQEVLAEFFVVLVPERAGKILHQEFVIERNLARHAGGLGRRGEDELAHARDAANKRAVRAVDGLPQTDRVRLDAHRTIGRHSVSFLFFIL